MDPDLITRLPLAWVHREFPNHASLLLKAPSDAMAPRQITPAFYGSYDWHSAVHGHWTLARMARLHPESALTPLARAALDRTLDAENIAGEVRNLARRPRFECPYGLAWLLTLAQELGEWADPDAARWARALAPLTRMAATSLAAYFSGLPRPVRTGEHSQSAFAMGLAIDWARSARDELERPFIERARALHAADHDAPLHREPSGADFLSPSLAEADLMRRVLSSADYALWLDGFLPNGLDLSPVVSPDRRDGRLAHLDGLNLSRAWMLEGIASALLASDERRDTLLSAAGAHATAGLTALESPEDSLTHWIGSFAAYLVTKRSHAGGT
jgi:hypothetical protein